MTQPDASAQQPAHRTPRTRNYCKGALEPTTTATVYIPSAPHACKRNPGGIQGRPNEITQLCNRKDRSKGGSTCGHCGRCARAQRCERAAYGHGLQRRQRGALQRRLELLMKRAAVHDVALDDVALEDMERATVGDVSSWAWCLGSLLNTVATPNSVIYTSLLDSGAFICRGRTPGKALGAAPPLVLRQ